MVEANLCNKQPNGNAQEPNTKLGPAPPAQKGSQHVRVKTESLGGPWCHDRRHGRGRNGRELSHTGASRLHDAHPGAPATEPVVSTGGCVRP